MPQGNIVSIGRCGIARQLVGGSSHEACTWGECEWSTATRLGAVLAGLSMRKMKARTIVLGILVAMLSGCAADSETAVEATVRDSLGVSIVEYASLPTGLPHWTVSEVAEVRVGSLDGSGPDVFGNVADVVETSEGVIVVADGFDRELRAFDSAGVHLWSAGQRGEGPGEFEVITAVSVIRGDSIAVFDGTALRVTIFTEFGVLARDYRLGDLAGTRPPRRAAGVTRAGQLVGLSSRLSPLPSQTARYETFVGPVFYDAVGSLVAEAPSLSAGDFVIFRNNDARRSYSSIGLPMGRSIQLAIGPETIAVATQQRFEILRYDGSGSLIEVLRVATPAVPPDEDRYEAISGPTGGFLADSLPALGRIHLDVADRLWVEEYVPLYEDRTEGWWVFTSDGNLQARATIPADFSPRVIGEDHVLGVTEDSLGVHYVERRRLLR